MSATKVLFVEDNNDIRYAVKESLRALDRRYQFFEAKSEKECFELLNKKSPDLIIMDVMLPHSDGIKIVDKIKSDKKYKDIKVIYLTARTDSASKIRGLKNADDFIEKPFDPLELDERIKNVMKKHVPKAS